MCYSFQINDVDGEKMLAIYSDLLLILHIPNLEALTPELLAKIFNFLGILEEEAQQRFLERLKGFEGRL